MMLIRGRIRWFSTTNKKHLGLVTMISKNLKALGVIFSALSLVFLAGCSKPKIDTSSDEALKNSTAAVRESLPQERRKAFDEALLVITFEQLDPREIFAGGSAGANISEAKAKQALSGKTAEEIIELAGNIKKAREAKQRQQALAEIQELLRKQAKANSDRLLLAKFEVVRSRFYQQQREFFGEDPVIELTVKNGTPHVVSRAYFTGTLASPGRSVPWVKDDFNYRIPGGLEPGETATWRLVAYTFGLMEQVKAPKDAILTVEVVNSMERMDSLFSRSRSSPMKMRKGSQNYSRSFQNRASETCQSRSQALSRTHWRCIRHPGFARASQISLTSILYGHGTAEAQRRLANALSEIIVPKGEQGGIRD
jgi:hypothetical protein